MKKVNTSANLPGMHDARSLHSTGKRSIPPSPKSAFLDLYMEQNRKERLEKEQMLMKKKNEQINQQLFHVKKSMDSLLTVATQNEPVSHAKKKSGHTYSKADAGLRTLEY